MKNSGLIYSNSLSYNEEMSVFIYTAFVGFGNTAKENLEQYQLQLMHWFSLKRLVLGLSIP
jgi:RsiW-degrading membrane proteinase PrsW (M82 family)